MQSPTVDAPSTGRVRSLGPSSSLSAFNRLVAQRGQMSLLNVFALSLRRVNAWFVSFWRQESPLAAFGLLLAIGLSIATTSLPSPGWAQTTLPNSEQIAQSDSAAPPLGTVPQALQIERKHEAEENLPRPLMLRRHVVVRTDVVRLGDLFDGSLADPDKPVFRAPSPGQSVDLDIGYLTTLAQREKLDWHPLSQSETATITRASSEIPQEEIIAALSKALIGKGMQETADIELVPPPPPLAVAEGSVPSLAVYSLRYDAGTGRFSAVVEITADNTPKRTLSVNGVTYDTIDIPVAATTTMRGDILDDKSIAWKRVRLKSIQGDIATDYDQVIGMSTRRVLKPGEPFRLRDLNRPHLVEKGGLVTMVLRTPMMQLTAQGRALQDGALGDVIKVQNPRSGKTILGTVVENRTVEIDAAHADAIR